MSLAIIQQDDQMAEGHFFALDIVLI